MTHTASNSSQPWWQVELAASSSISDIELWNRTDGCCTSRLSNVVVFVSDQDMTGRSLAQLEADPAVDSFSVNGTLGRTTTINTNNATGRFVRVQLRGNPAVLSLAEVVVNGSVATGAPTPAPPPAIDGFACFVEVDGADAVITFLGERGDSEQLRRNGSWAGTVTGRDDFTVSGGANEDFAVRVRGADFDNPFSQIACTNGAPATPTPTPTPTPPPTPSPLVLDTSITSPTNAEVVALDQVILSGEATAPEGIRRVRLVVQRSVDRFYLNEDGTYTPEWAAIDLDFNTPDQFLTWETDLPITDSGEYSVLARTFDNNRVRDETVAEVRFVVGSTDDEPAVVTVTGPATPASEDAVIVEGIATDDLGVQSVSFTVLERDSDLFLRPDGTLGESFVFTAPLSNPDGLSTEFSRALTGVPAGQYTARVEVRDVSGQRTVATRSWAQLGAASPPRIELASGGDAKAPENSQFAFSGSAEAEAGVERVEILIRNAVTWEGVGLNGALGPVAAYFPIPGTNGGTSVDWSYQSPALPAGTYEVLARVTDTFGALDFHRTQIVAGPTGDESPTLTITPALRHQQGLETFTVEIGGTATDDLAVADVIILIQDRTNNQWVQPDGSTSTVAHPFRASVANPGALTSDWNFAFTAPREGRYNFIVRSVDAVGQASSLLLGSGRVFPGDEIPTLTVTTPANGSVLNSQRISVTGRAFDDVAVAGVQANFRHLETGEYLRSDGTLGSIEWIEAALTNPGGPASNFDYQTPVIPSGTWVVTVRSEDSNEQTAAPTIRHTVSLN